MTGSFKDQLAGGKTLVAYGIIQIGMRLSRAALHHAVGLAYQMAISPDLVTMKFFKVTDEGLEMCSYVSKEDNTGYAELPFACNANDAADFVMNWLKSMINLDKRDIIDEEKFCRFAGAHGVDADGDHPDNFILVAHDGSGFTVRPAWMYYPK